MTESLHPTKCIGINKPNLRELLGETEQNRRETPQKSAAVTTCFIEKPQTYSSPSANSMWPSSYRLPSATRFLHLPQMPRQTSRFGVPPAGAFQGATVRDP